MSADSLNSPTSGVAPGKRGTYAGIIEKIPYLKDLGITVVELMPVHQFDPQEGSFWGYMTLNFFSPHRQYAADQDRVRDEFREMVRALHAAEIEVILDVVYNHTAEGDQRGPNYSFKGIDNSSLLRDDRRSDRPVRELYGDGQYVPLRKPERSSTNRGKPPVLGDRNACGWLPLRSGIDLHPRRGRLDRHGRLAADHCHSDGPGPQPRAPDRRALGCCRAVSAGSTVFRGSSGSNGMAAFGTTSGGS